MNNQLNVTNLPILLAAFLEENDIQIKDVAESIGCSAPTLNRIIAGKSVGNEELLKQCGILFEIGYENYKILSSSQKEKISEKIGTVSGAGLGFASISAAVGSLGTAGLSAAGISSGLATLGALVGGGMMAGVLVSAVIPIAAGTAGYGLIKGIKSVFSNMKVSNEDFDEKWEKLVK